MKDYRQGDYLGAALEIAPVKFGLAGAFARGKEQLAKDAAEGIDHEIEVLKADPSEPVGRKASVRALAKKERALEREARAFAAISHANEEVAALLSFPAALLELLDTGTNQPIPSRR